jgi:hypothetical protein
MNERQRAGPMSREHVGLLRRVSSMMRPAASREQPPSDAPVATTDQDVQARLERLESMLEDLQDATYRQSQRHDSDIEELRRSLQPEELSRSLSDDARRRGL